MRLTLKENPVEWQKFTAVMCVFPAVLAIAMVRKGHLPKTALAGVAAAIALVLLTAWIKPRWFRGFYRVGMTISFHVGQVMGRILLTLLFLLFVTPFGWLLRLAGKDLLRLRRNPQASTYWQTPRKPQDFDSQF